MSQYQLEPYNSDETHFDVDQLNIYTEELKLYSANGELVLDIGKERMISCSCFWDPSLTKKESDDSVLALVFFGLDGKIFVHRTEKLKGDANEQCRLVREFAVRFNVPRVTVETNGVGGFLPAILRQTMQDTSITVLEKHTTMSKARKILEAIETPLSSRRLYINSSVLDTSFRTQLRDFTPSKVGTKSFKDDFIDSVASAISGEPIRIKAFKSGERSSKTWLNQNRDFEVELEGFSY